MERTYPWKGGDSRGRCNTGLKLCRTTAVGLFVSGKSKQGVFDLAGNVWEWCVNDHSSPRQIRNADCKELKAIRGGAWSVSAVESRAVNRNCALPAVRNDYLGFRVLCSPTPSGKR